MRIPYDHNLKEKARYLRNNSTLSEVLLWNEIKKKKLGYDFHRQKPILKYIVDFYCSQLKLVIEIDGSSHNDKEAYDKRRQKDIQTLGICFIRFKEHEIRDNLDRCVEVIKNWIEENT